MQNIERDSIESLVDKYGLKHVLDAIADICHDKESHLEANWQDVKTAKVWARDANRIIRLSAQIENE